MILLLPAALTARLLVEDETALTDETHPPTDERNES